MNAKLATVPQEVLSELMRLPVGNKNIKFNANKLEYKTWGVVRAGQAYMSFAHAGSSGN